MEKYSSDQYQQNFSCDDDAYDAVAARIKKRIKRNKFTLVNIGAEKKLVCIMKKEARGSKEAGEVRNSGNNVGN